MRKSATTFHRVATASAPAKAILLGEHAVNRKQPSLATALDVRVVCTVRPRSGGLYRIRSGARADQTRLEDLAVFAARIDALRAGQSFDEIRELATHDFFAPTRYVLARLINRLGLDGLDAEISSPLRVGAGLGSGAAVSSSFSVAAAGLAGAELSPAEVTDLAWAGDAIAHGGVASGLDSSACAFGGVVRYTLESGPIPVAPGVQLCLVVGDTLVTASTAAVNTGVRELIEREPWQHHLFSEIGLLVERATEAIEHGDLRTLGSMMNLNQLVLEKLGVSSPELDRLVSAALAAGALGAKLSGSGGGGIVVALVEPERAHDVAAAIDAAGGRSSVVRAAAPGAALEPASVRG